MADICDVASGYAEMELQRRITQARPKAAGESLTRCEDCGDKIPEKRRRLIPGVRKCVDCQAERER